MSWQGHALRMNAALPQTQCVNHVPVANTVGPSITSQNASDVPSVQKVGGLYCSKWLVMLYTVFRRWVDYIAVNDWSCYSAFRKISFQQTLMTSHLLRHTFPQYPYPMLFPMPVRLCPIWLQNVMLFLSVDRFFHYLTNKAFDSLIYLDQISIQHVNTC